MKMAKFNVWLSDEGNIRQVSSKELHTLYNELNTQVVAIKGNGVFTLTYSVVASVRFQVLMQQFFSIW